MSFEEARNSLVISFAEGSISEEEFLILYQEYESVNPLYPYWEFEPFCLDSLDSSECKSEFRLEKDDIPIPFASPSKIHVPSGHRLRWYRGILHSAKKIGLSLSVF